MAAEHMADHHPVLPFPLTASGTCCLDITAVRWFWQVFLTIARKAEVEAAAQEGRSTETVHLANGAVLKVPLGEEFATVEGGTQQYQVKWAQDESGNLQV